MTLTDLFTSIANAIRNKKGTQNKIRAVDFATEIETISSGKENVFIDTNITNKTLIHLITSIKPIDLTNWTSVKELFLNCTNMVEPPKLTGELTATNASCLFRGCEKMTTGANYDISKVQNLEGFYYGCKSLQEVPHYDFSSATTLGSFYRECENLITVPDMLTTSNVTIFSSLFRNAYKLQTAPSINTVRATDMSYMFEYNRALTTVPEYDASNVINVQNMFYACSKLTEFDGLTNLGKAYTKATTGYAQYYLDLYAASNLTLTSAINILNNLYDLKLSYNVANGGTLYRQKIRFTNAVHQMIQSSEEGSQALANANNKGWDVLVY